jgi:hypothetical protein
MTNQCLNHRYITYDCCRNCKNQSVRCPEYLSDINYTHKSPRNEKLVGIPDYEPLNGVVTKTTVSVEGTHCESYNLANCCNEGTL